MAVSPEILYKDEPDRIWYAGAKTQLWKVNVVHLGINQYDNSQVWAGVHETEHCTGGCLIATRRLFTTIGFLDEDYFFGRGNSAFCWIAKKRGIRFGVNMNAKIYHKFGGSCGRANPVYIYWSNKNRLLILRKHGSLLEKVVGLSFYMLTRLIKFPILLSRGRGRVVYAELRAIRDFLLGRYGEYDRRRANCHD